MRKLFDNMTEMAGIARIYPLEAAIILGGITVILAIGGDLLTSRSWPAIILAFWFGLAGYLAYEKVGERDNIKSRNFRNRFRLFVFTFGAAVGLLIADGFVGRVPDIGELLLLLTLFVGYTLALIVQLAGASIHLAT